MLREKHYVLRQVSMGLDLALMVLAFLFAHALRVFVISPYLAPNMFVPVDSMRHYIWLLILYPPVTLLILNHNGFYLTHTHRTFFETVRTLLLSVAESALVVVATVYMFYKGDIISRGQTLLVPFFIFLFIAAKTVALSRVLIVLRLRGHNVRNLLLIGSGEKLLQFIELLENHPLWGFRVLGIISDNPAVRPGERVKDYPVVGNIADTLRYIERSLRTTPVDEVILVPSHTNLNELIPVMEGCEEMGLRTHLSLNFFVHTIARPYLDRFEDIPVVTYSPTRQMNAALLFKYAFDRIAAVILLILFSPVMAAIAIAIRLESKKGDPILFGQARCGINGKTFTLWKFRSMKIGAEEDLDRLRALNEVDGPVFKIRKDPRITRVGRFLRRTSLDELPQFWNVLRGEMSIVGPRPEMPFLVERYEPWQRRRLDAVPGMTGLWQILGRKDLPLRDNLEYDFYYIRNQSLLLDLSILLRTVPIVILGKGAY
ncbi:MAG: sugar transferase [bacterium]